ncbi:MAG: flagellar hook-associated protein FlgK [Candidatus Sericytochromatia bacterium]|nr:flagellar hook-associated protein FlgK [Candidatus Sericytochromatia bacterium]
MNVGLYASVAGLLTAQRAVDIASHNIANAETDGFSRQRGDASAALPLSRAAIGNVGTGVKLDAINRVRDELVDRQLRTEQSKLGELEARATTLSKVEQVLGEPSETALSGRFAAYYDAWQRLSTNPENTAYRLAVRDAAVSLTDTFRGLNTDLEALREELMLRAEAVVADLNQKATQIADLNQEIVATLVQGQRPNDLMDQRDLLIDQVSKLVKVQVVEVPSTGALNVYLGNQPLVAGSKAYMLDNPAVNAATDLATVAFDKAPIDPTTGAKVAASVQGGELKAILEARNVTLAKFAPATGQAEGLLFRLHQLATYVITDTNPIHTSGFDRFGDPGQPFFDGTNASDIAVSSVILTDAADGTGKQGFDLIAAAGEAPTSASGGKADNRTALEVIRRRFAPLVSKEVPPADPRTAPPVAGARPFEDYWQVSVSGVALAVQSASRSVTTQEAVLQTVSERRAVVSAVSTDEEMANVIRYQKAYAASARMISTIDQMLDLLVNLGR